MKKLKIGFVIFLTALSLNLFSQVKLIFDTDFGGDADDLGALAMLHHLAAKGECELLAIMCWATEQNAVPAIDAVNRFYKHPDVPVGVRKEGSYFDSTSYSKPIAENFHHELNHQTAIDATVLYRKILAESDDKSITIVVVGPLKNIENLIRSKGDIYSEFDGKTLISKKVKEFVIMGGQYPEGKKEWNFDGNMPGITRYVIQNIDVPITFSGFELGVNIKTGEVFNQIDKNTPLYVGFKYFSEHAAWMKQHYKGQILNNSTYDQTAVLYTVRNGLGIYWDRSENGVCLPDEVGGNKWQENRDGKHSFLKLKMSNNEMAQLIESLMLGNF
ncbi:MAG: nucleoside hydrolase [Bacteroidota bacterium]|nr:nucleoside hydrolase [Bacteroidota bacterium]